jgi:putative glutathione S-transferase
MEQTIIGLRENIEKAGVATSQKEYEAVCDQVYATLDELDAYLADKDYLVGNQVAEADRLLFDDLVRMDIIYYFAYRLNHSRLKEFPHFFDYAKRLFRMLE